MEEVNVSDGKVIFYENYIEIRYKSSLQNPKNKAIIKNCKIDSIVTKEYRLSILAYIAGFLFFVLFMFFIIGVFIPTTFIILKQFSAILFIQFLFALTLLIFWIMYKIKILKIFTGGNYFELAYNDNLEKKLIERMNF